MARKPYQIRREDLTDDQWDYLNTRLFPLLREMKRKAREAMAAKEAKA